jgi:hypothetical protein
MPKKKKTTKKQPAKTTTAKKTTKKTTARRSRSAFSPADWKQVLVSRKRSASGSCSVRAWTAWKEAADLDDPGEVHGATDGGDDQIATPRCSPATSKPSTTGGQRPAHLL